MKTAEDALLAISTKIFSTSKNVMCQGKVVVVFFHLSKSKGRNIEKINQSWGGGGGGGARYLQNKLKGGKRK